MARLDTADLDDLINEMRRMGELDGEVAQEMLDAAADIVKERWKEVAEQRGHVDTGVMIESIRWDLPPNAENLYRDIYPHGKDAKGVRNAEKAFILHYGRSNMPGDYWVDEAELKAGPEAIAKCQEIWDRFLNSRGG